VLSQQPSHVGASEFFATWLSVTTAAVALLPLWPLVRFKSDERTLTIHPGGISTKIGERGAEIRWADVRQIRDERDAVLIVSQNGNAFIVPARAFNGDVQRMAFLVAAREWHEANVKPARWSSVWEVGSEDVQKARSPETSRPRPRIVRLGVLWLLGLIALGWIVARAPLPFVDEWWRAGESDWGDPLKKRHRIADAFVMTNALIGKSRSELVERLGTPPETGYFSDWDLVYPLGLERGFMAIDSEWLVIRLDASGIAVEARIVRD